MKRDSDYRSHRLSYLKRQTPGGKGDMDRSDPQKFREGYDRVFGEREDPLESRDMSWLNEEDSDGPTHGEG